MWTAPSPMAPLQTPIAPPARECVFAPRTRTLVKNLPTSQKTERFEGRGGGLWGGGTGTFGGGFMGHPPIHVLPIKPPRPPPDHPHSPMLVCGRCWMWIRPATRLCTIVPHLEQVCLHVMFFFTSRHCSVRKRLSTAAAPTPCCWGRRRLEL